MSKPPELRIIDLKCYFYENGIEQILSFYCKMFCDFIGN